MANPADEKLVDVQDDRMTTASGRYSAWMIAEARRGGLFRKARDAEWVTTLRPRVAHTKDQARYWLMFAEMLHLVGPQPDLPDAQLTELASAWVILLETVEVEQVAAAMRAGRLHPD